jgi:predicted AlkP superfamily phosphohydrolase/phosphomutase
VLAVFQFDAVSIPRIERLLEAGRMPTFAELRKRGSWLELESPASHFPAATYATLYSGLDIPQHGQYYAFRWFPAEQRIGWRGEFPSPVTVWEHLARAGLRSLVIDPYECEPPRSTEGVVLAGYQFENVMSLRRWSAPRAAGKDLERLFGRSGNVLEVFGRPSIGRLLALRRRLLAATDRVADAAIHLLRRERFELVWLVMLAGHLGGHEFWDMSHLEDADLDESTRSLIAGTLDDIYEQMDHAVGRVLTALPDADVIVTSPMGMGVNMSRVDLLPGMLEAVLSGNGEARAQSRSERLLWSLRSAVPTGARAKVAAMLHGPLTRRVTMTLSTLGVDWSKTPVFMLPSDHFAQLRLNIRGRERDGIVEPGEVDELVDRLREGLLTFREEDGERTVRDVVRTREVLGDGEYLELLPDVVVRWTEKPSNPVERISSPIHGEVRRAGVGSGRSGAHTPHAWALVVSDTLKPSAEQRPHVRDVVPTICRAVDVEVEGLRGKPFA